MNDWPVGWVSASCRGFTLSAVKIVDAGRSLGWRVRGGLEIRGSAGRQLIGKRPERPAREFAALLVGHDGKEQWHFLRRGTGIRDFAPQNQQRTAADNLLVDIEP